MKFMRALSLPFAVAADLATLGNMGGRSFTQQVFDSERREQEFKAITEVAKAIAAQRGSSNGRE